ncbi:hypothetical protein SUGI_1498370 [Cryptomeria japonica]|uniref:Uncharacterized protein n=1 Tax=Cryptomeria japonica TaxID=3369 RepID=A0AAD3NNX8_CRYJA|nr:hypothetical protein SUGI_1498370 [Cryptomeria japonica]
MVGHICSSDSGASASPRILLLNERRGFLLLLGQRDGQPLGHGSGGSCGDAVEGRTDVKSALEIWNLVPGNLEPDERKLERRIGSATATMDGSI